MARDDLVNGWLAIANEVALLKDIARLAEAGELHISSLTPPGAPDGELTIVLRSSSPTAFAELGDALKRPASRSVAPTDESKTDLQLAREAAERVRFDGSLRNGSERWQRDLLTLCHFALFGEHNQGWPSQSSENRG